MKTILILLILFIICILILRNLKVKENLELPTGLDIMTGMQMVSDPHLGTGSGWNPALVPVFNGRYVIDFQQTDKANMKQLSLDVNLAKDKNSGTVIITETNTSARKDVANPTLTPTCDNLDELIPSTDTEAPPSLQPYVCAANQTSTQCPSSHPNVYTGALDGKTFTNGFCCDGKVVGGGCSGNYVKCSKPPCLDYFDPKFLEAKTTCKDPKWDNRLKQSIKAYGQYVEKVCGEWCLPDKYDGRIIYSWNSGKKAFDINSSECNKWKSTVKQAFLKIQKGLGVDINKQVVKTLYTNTYNVEMITPSLLKGKDSKGHEITITLENRTSPIQIKVQVYDNTLNKTLGYANTNNFNKVFYKVVKGQERDMMNYQLTSGLQSLNNNAYAPQVKQMIATDPCLADTGFSGSSQCYQKIFLQLGCTKDGADYSKMDTIGASYNKKYGLTTQALDRFETDYKNTYEAQKTKASSNEEARGIYQNVEQATLRCSGQAAANLLDPCDNTKFKTTSYRNFACFNKGDAPEGQALVEGLTSRYPNTSEWPKGSGKFVKNTWNNLGYNESQALNASLVPNLEDLIAQGQVKNYSQCVTNNLVEKSNPIKGDDSAKNQTREGICTPFFTNGAWNENDLKSYTTRKLEIKEERIDLGFLGHIDIPVPVYETVTINPPDNRKSQYKEQSANNAAQNLNPSVVSQLTPRVVSGELKNYSKCVDSALVNSVKPLPNDTGAKIIQDMGYVVLIILKMNTYPMIYLMIEKLNIIHQH